MAHEIEKHDHVVLHRERAWHGLGTIVQNAPTPMEALAIAKLDWEVQQWPMYATDGEGTRLAVDSVANVRVDTKQVLGIVGKGWTPFQNREVAEFCQALAEQNDKILIESAGSIRNGAKSWFLLKGESFSVRGVDEVSPYILVSNGFDGMTGFRCTPTTIRVVCSNTLHMVIPQYETSGRLRTLKPNSFVCKHTGNLQQRVQQAKEALQLYGHSLEEQRGLIDQVAARDVSREDVQQFFLECYTRDYGSIPTKAGKIRDKAMDAINAMSNRFDNESSLVGATAWTAFNAYTGWMQNDRKSHLKDVQKATESKLHSNLFGTNSENTVKAFATALSL